MRLIVYVRPRASSIRIVKNSDGSVKVYLTRPAVDGEANKQLIKVLAGHFDVAKSAVNILKGRTSKRKLVEIGGAE